MTFAHPDLGPNSIVFDAGRYLVVQIAVESVFAGYDNSDGLVIYDCELTVPIALIRKDAGRIIGNIISHVGYPDAEYASMAAAVKGFAKQHSEYLDTVMGPEN